MTLVFNCNREVVYPELALLNNRRGDSTVTKAGTFKATLLWKKCQCLCEEDIRIPEDGIKDELSRQEVRAESRLADFVRDSFKEYL